MAHVWYLQVAVGTSGCAALVGGGCGLDTAGFDQDLLGSSAGSRAIGFNLGHALRGGSGKSATENDVLAIQPSGLAKGDEKLGAVRVLS